MLETAEPAASDYISETPGLPPSTKAQIMMLMDFSPLCPDDCSFFNTQEAKCHLEQATHLVGTLCP